MKQTNHKWQLKTTAVGLEVFSFLLFGFTPAGRFIQDSCGIFAGFLRDLA